MTTAPHIADDPDGFHAEWLAAHQGLSEARSAILDARLVLLACIQAARAPWPAYDPTAYQPSPR